ncbi:hypothetical protein Sango_2268500 [Sesamum angolense]|uniref:Uncharacterized protein n=1 Tax=Sesamum angolense TaxID=2727404 RepID=A0AAE2BL22_9LAMI|nr:hypothetical protein Sango_2268500 [Sesamum angolense]
MRIHSPPVAFVVIVVIILTTSHLSDCRHLHGGATAEGPASSGFHSSRLSWYFSVPAPKKQRKQEDYRVSHRKTPGGPNPLHN